MNFIVYIYIYIYLSLSLSLNLCNSVYCKGTSINKYYISLKICVQVSFSSLSFPFIPSLNGQLINISQEGSIGKFCVALLNK